MKFFIERIKVSLLLFISIVLIGMFTYKGMPKNIQPDINVPFASITTSLPGSNPEDTESLITKKIEEEISGISGIKNMTSNSSTGLSTILIEFETSTDVDDAILKIKDAVERIKRELPEDASDPSVNKAESNQMQIISYSIIGNKTAAQLSQIAEEIKNELNKINGVSDIKIIGKSQEVLEINIDQKKSEFYRLDINSIYQNIKSNDLNTPIGTINSNGKIYSLRINNKLNNINNLYNLPLTKIDNSTIYLKDIADINRNYINSGISSKLSLNGQTSLDTITLQIYKSKNANTIKIVDEANLKIQEIQSSYGDEIQIGVSNDNSFYIKEDLGILNRSGIQTTILIIFVLLLAMGLREGLIAGLTIPVSILFAIIVLDIVGFTINSLTLFALVIALGLIVDTAIVIMEGIYDNMKQGQSSKKAALNAINTYKWPLLAGTATTVFAFFPMLIVSGIVGEFLKSLPVAISAALIGSLFISLTIGPSITAELLKNKKTKDKPSILDPFFKKTGEFFNKIIYKIVQSKKVKSSIIISIITLFVLSMAMPITGILKVEMFPATNAHFFIINVETTKGMEIEKTEKIVSKIEDKLYNNKYIENFLTIIGSSESQNYTDIVSVSQAAESNKANITVNLTPKNERDKKSYEIAEELRESFKNFNEAKVNIFEMREGPPSDSAITIRITGENLDTLKKISSDLINIVEKIPETKNTSSSLGTGLNEYTFTLNNEKIKSHGLSIAQVSNFIRNSLQGLNVSTLNLDNNELDLILKYNFERKNNVPDLTISDINSIQISSPYGYKVSLSEISNFKLNESAAKIERENEKRIVKIKSDITKEANAIAVVAKIEKELENYNLKDGYEISFGGDKENINESFNDLFKSMIVGVILIAFTLVLIFNSFRQPFIILLSLPLALIGVFPGLYLIGLNLSFPAFLGVVALSGIVVNDAIILIDRINNNRKNGIEFKKAIAEGTKSRLQPIIMTSITTVIGILPLALSNEFWAGLGFTIIFGLLFSTILTLIVMPIFYYIFEYKIHLEL